MDLRRAAERFLPLPMSFEDWRDQMPIELLDLIDRAHGRPVRSLHERYHDYLRRQSNPDELAAIARALGEAHRRNEEATR